MLHVSLDFFNRDNQGSAVKATVHTHLSASPINTPPCLRPPSVSPAYDAATGDGGDGVLSIGIKQLKDAIGEVGPRLNLRSEVRQLKITKCMANNERAILDTLPDVARPNLQMSGPL